MSEELTGLLAAFAARLTSERIPERTRERVKDLLLDAFACALAGYDGEDTAKVARFAALLGESGESTVIGGSTLSIMGATALNGFLTTAVSMCDVYRPTATHLQPVVVPAALAVAERDDLSGAELLAALAAGFEVATRIGAAIDYKSFRGRGWHGPGTIGPFGAAAAAGRLLGFDTDTMARAFGLAGSQAGGTFAAWGTPSVKFHQFRGALSGLMGALLAQQGFMATREFLTAKDGGFFPTYVAAAPRDAAARELGKHWELEQIALRPWPTSAASQGPISAMLSLVAEHDLKPSQVRRVRITVSEPLHRAYAHRRSYRGKWEASSSIHYTTAAALHDRDVWLDQLEASRHDDPELRAFVAESIDLAADSALSDEQALVEAELVDGTVLRARCEAPKGSPENRMSRAEIETKFRKGARGRLSMRQTDRVIEMVGALETLDSSRALMRSLAREIA